MNNSRVSVDGEHIAMSEYSNKLDKEGAASNPNENSAPLPSTASQRRPSISQLKFAMSKKLPVNKLLVTFVDPNAPPPVKPGLRDVFLKTGVDGLPQLYESYQERRARLNVQT
jgi:hypothetical protein